MPPVATDASFPTEGVANLKIEEQKKAASNGTPGYNPFYSHDPSGEAEPDYEYEKYKPYFPVVDWEPLGPIDVGKDRGFFADKSKKNLLGAAGKVNWLGPDQGVEIEGLDLRHLTTEQKDELALLAAEVGIVIFRNQPITIEEQLEFGRHYGPLHKHATTAVPKQPGLEEVHVVYADKNRRPDPAAFSKTELFHSDVTYELQPPALTSLKIITAPALGGDTIFANGYAVYDSFSPEFQKYLDGLYAVHSAKAQADGAKVAGTHVRREAVDSIHPVVRVHPVTGWKSIFVNPGFTRAIVGLPKHESDAILNLLFNTIALSQDFHTRVRWGKDDIVIWDNRVITHSAIFNVWPQRRHALRVTPHGEAPTSVADHDAKDLPSGKARSRQLQLWEEAGIEALDTSKRGKGVKGYND